MDDLKNGVHLITYADSLGKNIPELHCFLKKRLTEALVGVHLLPFYPSSADRGFAPITYREVEGSLCLFEKSWSAEIMTMRQPVSLPRCFGTRSSMSFFLYNQDGRQAIARPYLDGIPAGGVPGSSTINTHVQMP